MAKNLKLNIKNAQIAQAIDLEGLKSKLAKKKEVPSEIVAEKTTQDLEPLGLPAKDALSDSSKEDAPRVRARTKSAFAEPTSAELRAKEASQESSPVVTPRSSFHENLAESKDEEVPKRKTSEELRKEIFGDEPVSAQSASSPFEQEKEISSFEKDTPVVVERMEPVAATIPPPPPPLPYLPSIQKMAIEAKPVEKAAPAPVGEKVFTTLPPREKLGPTGRHVKDLLPKQRELPPRPAAPRQEEQRRPIAGEQVPPGAPKPKTPEQKANEAELAKKALINKPAKAKEFRDIKPAAPRKVEPTRSFDARDRQGLRASEETPTWRKRRQKQAHRLQEDTTIRPTTLKVRMPIVIKDLAAEMKLKASQLIQKLFMQGVIVTLNDFLDDETTIQLLGQEFGCEITIDTAEKQRLQVTDKTIREEIAESDSEKLIIRPPIVAFMGHVDHGKTSLIDAIRKSDRAAGEAGAITQHIGAFKCHTAIGDIAILDTPGHEAFSAMRARGADVTDIVVLVVAGDEGIRQQTIEAIQHAKAAKVSIVVAINKSDKPNFNVEQIYRQLSEHELLPEAWGGETITVNCSAVTGDGIQQLLEMLALQAEVLELKSDPTKRARGSVLESEMHKGMGAVATVLVQNGTLRLGDALVFGQTWGRIKTMHDENGKNLLTAGPSTPVEITGLSGLPEAGEEFIIVKNEREAREIAEGRSQDIRQNHFQLKKKMSMENLFLQAAEGPSIKTLNIVLRADVQGSLEALKTALMKIHSKKAEINIISTGVGEVLESDVQLAAASKAVIIGFHTQIESHADELVKQLSVQVKLHNIIYHAIDDVKAILADLLDKVAIESDKG
ncbi:MAG: translation initiation factor IF-2 [Parachlamydiaceae bacterium]|nr:translation initiation factor IF-2 [Parachlamydiaceae bacterium]